MKPRDPRRVLHNMVQKNETVVEAEDAETTLDDKPAEPVQMEVTEVKAEGETSAV